MSRLPIFAVILLLLSVVSFSLPAEQRMQQPVLGPEKVVELVTTFLAVHHGGRPRLEDLSGISFDYLTGQWWLHYQSKDLIFGNHATVIASNEPTPTIRLVGGI